MTEYDYHDWGLLVDGTFGPSESGDRFDVENPADGTTIGSAPDATAGDMDAAIEAAEDAYDDTWQHVSARNRVEYLLEIADRIEAEFDEFVRIETLENGKPLYESENDVEEAIQGYRYYAGAADKHHGDTIPEKEGLFDYTVNEPYGVVGVIIPWNWPPMHSADFTAAPLAAGNTVVIKPAPETPLSTLKMAEIWADVLPDGVVNVVTGGTPPGARLTSHETVNKIAFTGHDETGKKVMQAAAENITDVMLELGGKNPNLVLPDADIDDAVDGAFHGIFDGQGQVCASGSRLLLHDDVYDEFVQKLVARTREMTIGPGTDEETDLAPLVSQAQYDKVTDYVDIGKDEGATVLYEGTVPDDVHADGYYVPPVIFGDVDPEMRIAREEIFGPVLSVFRYESVEEAIEMANDTEYGLTGAVWSTNMEVANRVARRLEAGLVFVNNFVNGFLGAPFGGYGKSGIGRKLGFEETMGEFTRTKTIRTAIAGSEPGDLDEYYD
ncbi:aldehyde dehydrogenase [Halorubellus sp. JP-L1]|uniref:aldehyde dehydrogenase family protein n=1 Tax=Halorubellus sp. JP-L1 TaxID=2715753 RepID=UPI00140E1092|nr:aldehyde dehydrogenase family protein [Halorubellus sp. JP-L1]NHN43003.1 aldehyde dehydrogenase [Halorubellus sp. JP-L1]